jgi:putative glutamine amidotransferase
MSQRPLIGITGLITRYIDPPHLPMVSVNRRYVMAVEAAGGAPLVVPAGLDAPALAAIFERLDGVLLSGGGDVDPAYYGETPRLELNDVSLERDRPEIALARWAVERDKPVMSICRGIQVFNVALGGTLVQDIPTQLVDALPHMFDGKVVPREHIAHTVAIDSGTRLRELIGAETAQVNSWHHQSLMQIAPALTVSARAPDGVVEAAEVPGHRFAVGVQWHPEWLYDRQPEMLRLFEGLVQAAK